MKPHFYSDDEKKFFKNYTFGHSYAEIRDAFIKKFGWNISLDKVKGCIARYNLSTGKTGRFEKGHVPFNKGKKGEYAPGSEKGWFKKENIPATHRDVGSERINVDGYVEIKVREPSVWKLKHRIVWEKHNGPIPDGYIIILRDGNKTNTDLSNLMIIKKSTNAILNRTDLHLFKNEYKDIAVKIAELKVATSKGIKARNSL